MRDDTVSVGSLVLVTGLPGCLLALIVPFLLDLTGPGCAAAADLAPCNTNGPCSARAAGRDHGTVT